MTRWLASCVGLLLVTAPTACGDKADEGGNGDDSGTGSGVDGGDDGSGDGGDDGDDGGGSGSGGTGTGATGDDGGTGTGDGGTGDDGGTGTGTGTGSRCQGLGSSGLMLHTTLDDAASVNTPAVGNGMGQVRTMPADDFVPALSGNGVNIDAGGEMVEFPQMTNSGANVDLSQGTVDFCFQPHFDSDGLNMGDEFGFFSTTDVGEGWIRMRVSWSNGRGGLQVIVLPPGGNVNEIMVPPTAYSFAAGEWYRVTISWDFGVGTSEQNIHVYVDGNEVISPMPPTGPVAMGNASANGDIVIGAIPENNWHANGVIDDFKLYDSALAP